MRGHDRDENLLSELLHCPDPRPVALKAERDAPLYSLKIACNTILRVAESAGTLHYLNLEHQEIPLGRGLSFKAVTFFQRRAIFSL